MPLNLTAQQMTTNSGHLARLIVIHLYHVYLEDRKHFNEDQLTLNVIMVGTIQDQIDQKYVNAPFG